MSDDYTHKGRSFGSLYGHGFVRVAAAVPHVRVGDPAFNAERTLALARPAPTHGAALVIFPELGLSAYSSEDLFHQERAARRVLDGAIARDRRGERSSCAL